MAQPSAMKKMDPGLMKYQYEQIGKHLLLLQDHAAARTCPYSPAGEACIRKHLLAIEAYAQETIPMEDDPGIKEKLESLEVEASGYRVKQEALLCGEEAEPPKDLDHWARRWRKEFEARALPCELERRVEEAKEAAPAPA